MDVIERVARALASHANPEISIETLAAYGDPVRWARGFCVSGTIENIGHQFIPLWQFYLPAAQVALEAMRQPSKEMIEAARRESDAVINEAISEKV